LLKAPKSVAHSIYDEVFCEQKDKKNTFSKKEKAI